MTHIIAQPRLFFIQLLKQLKHAKEHSVFYTKIKVICFQLPFRKKVLFYRLNLTSISFTEKTN